MKLKSIPLLLLLPTLILVLGACGGRCGDGVHGAYHWSKHACEWGVGCRDFRRRHANPHWILLRLL